MAAKLNFEKSVKKVPFRKSCHICTQNLSLGNSLLDSGYTLIQHTPIIPSCYYNDIAYHNLKIHISTGMYLKCVCVCAPMFTVGNHTITHDQSIFALRKSLSIHSRSRI